MDLKFYAELKFPPSLLRIIYSDEELLKETIKTLRIFPLSSSLSQQLYQHQIHMPENEGGLEDVKDGKRTRGNCDIMMYVKKWTRYSFHRR